MVDTTAPQIVTALSVMTAVSLAFIILRYFCKGRYGKTFGWDDYILAFSWVGLLLYSVFTIVSCKYGIGRHITEIPSDDLKTGLELLYIGEFFAIIAVAISKTSFSITLLRLATKHWQRNLLWFIIVSLNVIMWLCGIFQFVQCSPVRKLWDLDTPGTCWDPHITINYAIFAGSYSAAMDFLLAVFPWLLIWKLQMRTAEKIGVGVAMSLGVLAGITAAIKTSYLVDIGRWTDFTYSSANLLIWAASETAITIIAASIPYLRLMAKEVSSRSKKSTSNAYQLDNFSASKSRFGGTASRISRRVVVTAIGKHDDRSEKSILGEERVKGKAIMQTNEIAIVYQDDDVESQAGTGKSTFG